MKPAAYIIQIGITQINGKITISCKIPLPKQLIKLADFIFHPDGLIGSVMNTAMPVWGKQRRDMLNRGRASRKCKPNDFLVWLEN